MSLISRDHDFSFAFATKRNSSLNLVEKSEKSAMVKIALLAFRWPLALNHLYEGNAGNGLIAIIGTWIVWVSTFGIVIWVFPYFNAVSKP